MGQFSNVLVTHTETSFLNMATLLLLSSNIAIIFALTSCGNDECTNQMISDNRIYCVCIFITYKTLISNTITLCRMGLILVMAQPLDPIMQSMDILDVGEVIAVHACLEVVAVHWLPPPYPLQNKQHVQVYS